MENYGLEALKVLEESPPPNPAPGMGFCPACMCVCLGAGGGIFLGSGTYGVPALPFLAAGSREGHSLRSQPGGAPPKRSVPNVLP